jgi:hypothetical protein
MMPISGFPIPTFLHDAQAELDYPVDWSAWLPTGDTITASAWSGSVEVTLTGAAFTTTSTTVFASFAGPVVDGDVYTITNHITTAQGREEDQSVKLKIKAR